MPTAIDISSVVGLIAVGTFTAQILLGLLLSVGYNPIRGWPRLRWGAIRRPRTGSRGRASSPGRTGATVAQAHSAKSKARFGAGRATTPSACRARAGCSP